jgi:Adenylate cyclase, family 3 (some proteins contain HAMP domain)
MVLCPNCGEENPEKFRLCGFCGAELAPALPPQEVRKTVTIVFSDLKGSTAMAEKLDSEAVREVMSRYFDEMRGALERHGGTIEKYIGDAIMAVFGLPRVHEDDALRAVRAAVEMRDRLAALNEELDQRWGVTIGNRTGVNTGEVVAGDVTTGQRLVTGDTVNTAARLEQAAPTSEVLIGEATYRLVRHAVDVEPVEPLELKGKQSACRRTGLSRREKPRVSSESTTTRSSDAHGNSRYWPMSSRPALGTARAASSRSSRRRASASHA